MPNIDQHVNCADIKYTDTAYWDAVAKDIASYFFDDRLIRDISYDSILNTPQDKYSRFLGPIDWSWAAVWKVADYAVDSKLLTLQEIYKTNCNQVEFLLREAAMLIDRALADQVKYDDLNVDR